jgi:hypothetical protein
MAISNGVMKMRPLEKGLVIEPGKTVKLAPGGLPRDADGFEEPAEAG